MNPRSIIVAVMFAVMPITTLAQSLDAVKDKTESDPPAIRVVLSETRSDSNAVMSQVLDVPVEIPLGPIDVLRDYESAMTAVAETTVAALSGISQAVLKAQITREEADYLIQETYQRSMMQYQTLSTLHDSLEYDIAHAASEPSEQPDAPDTTRKVEASSARQTR